MSRSSALAIVILLWAAIYLPALGTLEIKGEEGRRILPAITMIDTGNYLVPQIGSEPYFRKPPLVNWLVAAAFQLTGTRNEWTARLPSVLSVFAVALAFVTVARNTLGAASSLTAAVIWLTSFGIIEKGRLIEIEALYVSLFGLAFICWISWWNEGRSPWFTWTVPWLFLGLGLLAKGPLHLVFFYSIVLAVLLLVRRDLAELWHPAHLLGLALMLGIFAAWAIPCLQLTHGTNVTHTWSRQLTGRLGTADFKFAGWLLNIPRAVGYFLPWVLLIPLLRPRLTSADESKTARALFVGICLPALIILLLPSALPRYVMPLLAPAAWLLALTLRHAEFGWFRHQLPRLHAPQLAGGIALATSLGLVIYAIAVVPKLQKRQKVRTIAAEIDSAIGPGSVLYAVDPDYQPFLFYLRSHTIYVSEPADVPYDAQFILAQPENARLISESVRWAPRQAVVLRNSTDYRARSVILFAIR